MVKEKGPSLRLDKESLPAENLKEATGSHYQWHRPGKFYNNYKKYNK